MDERALRWSAWVYGIGLVIHTADHFRRGTGAVVLIEIAGALAMGLAALTMLRAKARAAV